MLIDDIRNIKGTKKDLRKFGWTIGTVLLIISIILFWTNKSSFPYFGAAGILLIIFAVLFPSALRPLNKTWMTFAVISGWLMTRIILTVFFYLVITPIGILAKIFGQHFLDLKTDKSVNSYWVKRELKIKTHIDYERQF